jgi:hypothetical protein
MGLGEMGLGEMVLGEMVLGDMDIHRNFINFSSSFRSRCLLRLWGKPWRACSIFRYERYIRNDVGEGIPSGRIFHGHYHFKDSFMGVGVFVLSTRRPLFQYM